MRTNSEADYWSQFQEATPDQLNQFEQNRLHKKEASSDVSQFKEATAKDLEAWKAHASPQEIDQLNRSMQAAAGQPTTIGQDIKESITGAPAALGQMAVSAATELPGQAGRSLLQIGTKPIRATENVIAGLLEGLKGGVNIPSYVSEYLGEKDVPVFRDIAPYTKKLRIGDTGLQKLVLGEPQSGDALLQSLGQFMPYARLGAGAKGLAGLAKRTGAAGAFGVSQQEDPLHSALLSLVGEGAVKGVKSIPKLRPSKLITSPLSPEELRTSLRVAEGTETGLGEVIDNPWLQRQYQNTLAKIPFSGANQAMQRTATKVTNKGYELLDELLNDTDPSASENVGQHLTEALKTAEKEVMAKKDANFDRTNARAEKVGLKIGRDNFSSTAKEILNGIEKSSELKRELPPAVLGDLKAYSNPDISNTLRLSNIFKGRVGDKGAAAWRDGKKYEGGLYSKLKKALDKDMQKGIKNSGDPSLKELNATDMKFYKEHVVPFEDKKIMAYTHRGGDPDTIASAFTRVSRLNDQANLIDKLQSKLPADKKNLLAFDYFSRALEDGVLKPGKMNTLYKKLGAKQRKVLIPEEALRKKLKDYGALAHKNVESLNLMFNPKTGQRSVTDLIHIASLIAGAGAGALSGSLPIGMAVGGVLPVAGRAATKYLTSPKTRGKVVKRLIKQKEEPIRTDQGKLRDAVRAILEASNASN